MSYTKEQQAVIDAKKKTIADKKKTIKDLDKKIEKLESKKKPNSCSVNSASNPDHPKR